MRLFPRFPRTVLIIAAVLILSNLVTAWCVRTVDFSSQNMSCLINWGNIAAQFEDARAVRMHLHENKMDDTAVYHLHENNARFVVHYPKYSRRIGLEQNRALAVFCWAVAADEYHNDNVNVQIDPEVWQAYLADGPKTLPIYWELRGNLARAGADHGMLRASDEFGFFQSQKPLNYSPGPLPTPYQPRPGEATPS